MAVRFECPKCNHQMSAKADFVGKAGKCKCGTAIIVPGNAEKMKFACRHCGKGISVSNRHAGKSGKCPLCKKVIHIPLLGIPAEAELEFMTNKPAVNPDTINVMCEICNTTIQANQSSAGMIKECPQCGSFVEIPDKQKSRHESDTAPQSSNTSVEEIKAGAKSIGSTRKIGCPSCLRMLAADAPVCTQCGIYIKSGRPILTAWDVDEDEIEEKAHGIVGAVSWLIPFGIYPVYSEAMGHHKPYATWAITAVTVLISIWFLIIDLSGSPQMMSAKNLMLWNDTKQLDAEQIQIYYEYTSYGDTEAFLAKRKKLSGTVPEEQLDIAAFNALNDEQQCFGQYHFYQLITHAFLHGGIMHLAGNMLFLLVFGSRVNAAIGNILTLILYPILAITAAAAHLASMGVSPPVPMLGASGAVMGMAGAYLLLYPIHKIYMVIWMRWGLLAGFHLSFKCFALRGFWVLLFYVMFDVVAVSLTMSTGTAHWAHIGGLISGIVIAFGLLAGRLVYSRSDLLSLILGKRAWPIIGTPQARLK